MPLSINYQRKMIKPLDIVRTPKGGIAMVSECSVASENYNINTYSVDFIINTEHEHNAWYLEKELEYLASIPILISKAMCHPFGNNAEDVEKIFNNL